MRIGTGVRFLARNGATMVVGVLAIILAQPVLAAEPRRISVPAGVSGRIAFTSPDNGFWQIWILDCASGQCQQVTDSVSDKRSPNWNADGQSIFYRTTNGRMERVELQSGKTSAIAPALGFIIDPALSPTGDRVAFARFETEPPDNTDLFVYEFKTGKSTKVADSSNLDRSPAWSPDGSKLAYISGRGRISHFLHVMNADGSAKLRLQDQPSDDMCPTWSPDGKWIVFPSRRSGDYEIWRVSPSGMPIQQLTRTPGLDANPRYAPDGSHIVFTSNRSSSPSLWLMKPDGSDTQPLTPRDWPAREPAWWQPIPAVQTQNTTPTAEGKP